MRFLQIVDSVKTQLNSYSVQEKVEIFKEVFNYPINYSDGVFYFSGNEYTEHRMSDYLSIRIHWMNMHDFNILFNYFENLKQKDK